MTDTTAANRLVTATLAALLLLACTGCASIPGDPDSSDPWEPFNRGMYNFNDAVDKAIVAPVADAYLKLPDGGRTAIHNFFVNLGTPTTIINQFLQGKFERGLEDTMRFSRATKKTLDRPSPCGAFPRAIS